MTDTDRHIHAHPPRRHHAAAGCLHPQAKDGAQNARDRDRTESVPFGREAPMHTACDGGDGSPNPGRGNVCMQSLTRETLLVCVHCILFPGNTSVCTYSSNNGQKIRRCTHTCAHAHAHHTPMHPRTNCQNRKPAPSRLSLIYFFLFFSTSFSSPASFSAHTTTPPPWSMGHERNHAIP